MEKARDRPGFTFLSMSDCRRSLHRQIYHINMMCGISKYIVLVEVYRYMFLFAFLTHHLYFTFDFCVFQNFCFEGLTKSNSKDLQKNAFYETHIALISACFSNAVSEPEISSLRMTPQILRILHAHCVSKRLQLNFGRVPPSKRGFTWKLTNKNEAQLLKESLASREVY